MRRTRCGTSRAVGAATTSSSENSTYWKFRPFKTLEKTFLQLEPQTEDTAVTAWRDDPFLLSVVARNQPVACMQWMGMKTSRS